MQTSPIFRRSPACCSEILVSNLYNYDLLVFLASCTVPSIYHLNTSLQAFLEKLVGSLLFCSLLYIKLV